MGKKRKKKGAFPKLQKKKSYFMRYQTKFRRRRECKTDYYARRRLVTQDTSKYGALKYRFVVRITNHDIVTQVIYSKIEGDHVLAVAYSHELPKYGVKVGFTNYPAAYCTGLLCARRVLKKLGMDKMYEGTSEVDGKHFLVEENEDRRPFKCLLDIGLARSTTGAKIFAALKGACDGGLYIPHNTKRFQGTKNGKYNPKVHRQYILGEKIAGYMKFLQKKDNTKYQKQFSKYIENNIEPDQVKDMYLKAHKLIRENPVFEKKTKKVYEKQPDFRVKRLTLEERKERVRQKIIAAFQRMEKLEEERKNKEEEEEEEEDEESYEEGSSEYTDSEEDSEN
ncbi:ribosomal protein L5-RELATED [Anaeramoeba flamelloides]|uniref:Ribosomal protein L5-RELATED n=1 Tax=Anaeramoeba flamelloides TaxID=1746091 RepID=A0ABQ8Z8V2_9EUKA|nr:ribosomal protein L5-RELATED [Anaeramoeba flamelloides]